MSIKTYIRYVNYSDELECAVIFKAYDGKRYCLPLTKFIELEHTEQARHFLNDKSGPPVNEILQSILDAAWEHGMRPTGFKSIADETAAIKYHLEDMRKIAFDQLKELKPSDILAKYVLK